MHSLRWLALIAIPLNAAEPPNWPQFRGPNASGIATATATPPIEFGPTKRLLWKQAVPVGHSSPVVWGDRIFIGAFDPASKKLELLCLSAKTGAVEWRRVAPAPEIEPTHIVSNPATATPLVDQDRVYAYFSSFGLLAFTHAGESKWTVPLPRPDTHHGSGASPILAGDLLILNHDAKQGGYLLAVDRATGKEVWKQAYASQRGRVESWSTPIVWRDQVVLHRNSMIQAFHAKTGEPSWTLPAATSGASTPIAADNMIYVSTWNNLGEDDQRPSLPDYAGLVKLYDKDGDGAVSQAEFPAQLKYTARPELDSVPNSQNFVAFRNVDRNGDGLLQSAEWDAFRTRVTGMAQDHGLLAIRAEGGEARIAWRENSSIPEVPSPLLYQGRVYLIRNGGIATCLDAATGKMIYRARVGAPGAYFASPIVANGRVYLASSEGVVTVVATGKDQFEALAHNELDEEIVATPAIAGKSIYVRTARNLYAFGDR